MPNKSLVLSVVCVFFLSSGLGLGLAQEQPKQEKASESKTQEKPAEKTEAKPPEPKEKTFEEIVKDAKKLEGLFTLYQKDDKLYMEILPSQFGKRHLFIPTLWTSVGYGGAGDYLADRVFVLEKLDKKILLVWKNTNFTAQKSSQYKRSLENVVPESIAHAFKVESEPHPERKSFLVLLDDFFFSDVVDLGGQLSTPQNAYSLDKARTVWGKNKIFPKNIELDVRYTMTSAKPRPEPTVPDPRVFTLRVRYSISELPENNGFRPRLADDRVGYFVTRVYDYDKLDIDGTVTRYVNRWNLEKKDPGAKLSEPKEPIVFWLENTIPLEFRTAIRDGLLEWNKAFEKAGFKNAMVVKEMPDDADWDPADIRYNTIRWVASLSGEGGGAFGPSRVNPFTGQILDADVVMFAPINFIFSYQVFDSPLGFLFPGQGGYRAPWGRNIWSQDNIMLGWQRDYAIFDMLANGRISDVKEVPKEFLYEFYKFLGCHEVGHTLGLRHNFKGSMAIKLKDLHNKNITSKESIGNSIMEYLPSNVAPKGVKQGEYYQTTVGAWDKWVIEYGYAPIEASSPEAELPALSRIAARSNEPELVYGADEDAYDFGQFAMSIDPECVTWDLSDDPLAYSEQEVQRTKDLWRQLEKRALFEGKSYAYLRRGFSSSLYQYFSAMDRIVKWIGGIYHKRTHVGDPGQVLPYQVVEYGKQRRAFDIIKNNLLKPDAFAFNREFIAKLQVDRFMDFDYFYQFVDRLRLDFSLSDYLQSFYRAMTASLYDPMRLHRIQDNEMMAKDEKLTLGTYMGELFEAIWQELKDGKAIGPYRRILQREYLARATDLVLKPPAQAPEDAISISRHQLKELDKSIKDYLAAQASADLETRAHLETCTDLISEALKAVYVRNMK
jgi:Met-zincin/Domain of unknown function (DUF5117)/Domain of unknown function (DUF5118)